MAGRAGPTVSLKLSPPQSLASSLLWVWTAEHWVQVQNPAPWSLNMGHAIPGKCTHTHTKPATCGQGSSRGLGARRAVGSEGSSPSSAVPALLTDDQGGARMGEVRGRLRYPTCGGLFVQDEGEGCGWGYTGWSWLPDWRHPQGEDSSLQQAQGLP